MEKIKQRLSKNNVLENAINDRVLDEEEFILADDSDAFLQQRPDSDVDISLSLKLKLSESSNVVPERDSLLSDDRKTSVVEEDDDFVFVGDSQTSGQTAFEIISTETVKPPGHSTYVVYRILLTKSSCVDKNPCIVEKRFSEFETLHSDLKKIFPRQMEQISFPKKKLVGNFTLKTIAKRSRAFEQYLSHIYSIDEMRFSHTFLHFFYLTDLNLAYKHVHEENYDEAILLFQNVLPVQERIVGYINPNIGTTLCALVASCHASGKEELGLTYGRAALKCYAGRENNMYYLPLLQTCIFLCWKLGKEKQDLEDKLSQSKRNSKELPSLLTVIQESVN